MQKRVGHWAIVCVIRQLALVPHKALLRLSVEPSTETDVRLASFLLYLNTEGRLAKTLSHYRPKHVDGDDIPHLLSACKKRAPLYTKDVAVEFHHLIVATLLAYAAYLARYRVSQEDGLIVANGILLHAIVYSNAFKAHMKSLSATDPPVLGLPMSSHITEYSEFARINEIACHVPRGKRESSKQGTTLPKNDPTGATADGEIVDATTDSEIFGSPTEPVDLNIVMESWMRLLVKYHTAQRTLEKYCEHLGTSEDSQIDITRLSVKPKQGFMPTWSEINPVLTHVLQSESEQPFATNRPITQLEETIDYLKSYVLNVTKVPGRSPNNIFDNFTDIINGRTQPIRYTIHCEAALVAFASTKYKAFQDDRLGPLQKVRIL